MYYSKWFRSAVRKTEASEESRYSGHGGGENPLLLFYMTTFFL